MKLASTIEIFLPFSGIATSVSLSPFYVFTAVARSMTDTADARSLTDTAAARSMTHTSDKTNRMNQS